MKITGVPFHFSDWNKTPKVKIPGESGFSYWKSFESGNIRARIVEYSPGFRSDHWCGRGHVLFCLEGELDVELKDGRQFKLTPGTGFQAEDDNTNPHLAWSDSGAKVFIVD